MSWNSTPLDLYQWIMLHSERKGDSDRQSDPLSPLLFLMLMEMLNRAISLEVM